MAEFDFSNFDPKTANPNTNSGSIMFIKGRNTSGGNVVTCRPIGRVTVMSGFVFDPELKRNRKARPGEKPRTQFLFNGVDPSGAVKTYVAGSQVIAGIKSVREIRESNDVFVDITSTGAGLETEYAVRPAKNKNLDGRIDESKLGQFPDLAAVAASLVQTDTPPAPNAPRLNRTDDNNPF